MRKGFLRCCVAIAFVAWGMVAHAQTSPTSPGLPNAADDADSRLRRIMEATQRVGQSPGGNCETCPQACETRCAQPGDTKCEAELRKERAKMFAACRANKKY